MKNLRLMVLAAALAGAFGAAGALAAATTRPAERGDPDAIGPGVTTTQPATQPAAQAATRPATRPSVMAPASQPGVKISPEVQKELDALKEAYGKLTSLALAGTVHADFDVAGEKVDETAEFTAAYQAPNKLRHEMKDDVVLGSTGEKAYAFRPSSNGYLSKDAPKEKGTLKDWPRFLTRVLQKQNPSLVLVLSDDAGKALMEGVTAVSKEADVTVEGKAFPALKLTGADGSTQVLIDPQTHLLRRMTIDTKSSIEKRGQDDVKKALLTFDYSKAEPETALKAEQFAWAPPAGSKDMAEMSRQYKSAQLEGKPAPEFTLKDLNGKDVSLKDFKGQVLVIDFWATWCGPCVEALPELDKMYQELSKDGLKVVAINLEEEKDTVAGFAKEKNLTMPVLLDADHAIGQKYLVEPIPQTVIIGKDGVVRRVVIGAFEDTVRDEIDAAMKAK
ncbi:MAG TPA: TlpA disulfide reductase family protein [Tepidisphaeraceae bacterium]|jgi:peroxiredoxin/outer membrane lipoprotein-sorting protein